MTRTRRPSPKVAIRAGLAILAAGTLVAAPGAAGQEGAGAPLGGYQGTAAAQGLKVTYNPSGLLPTGAPVDLGAPDALATIATGPSTFARASVADPGDLLANPNALIGQLDPDAPRLPEYPFRVAVTSGVGAQEAESAPAPGLNAKVRILGDGSAAVATSPRLEAPAIATVGSMKTEATTTTDGLTVTVRARTEISKFDLLGIVTIESIVTDVTATSDGVQTTVEGGTTLGKATVLGDPVTIDADGVESQPGEPPPRIPLLGDLFDLDDVLGLGGGDVAEALEDLGIRITVLGPVAQEAGTVGQLSAGGLRIDLELSRRTLPLLGEVLDSLPPIENPLPGAPGIEDLLAVAEARHLVNIGLGAAAVSLEARPAFVPEPFTPPASTGGSTGGGTATPSFTPTPAAPTPSSGATTPSTPSSVPVVETTAPVASLSAGIGLLALVALLLQPLVGERLAAAAGLILTGDDSESCPREGT